MDLEAFQISNYQYESSKLRSCLSGKCISHSNICFQSSRYVSQHPKIFYFFPVILFYQMRGRNVYIRCPARAGRVRYGDNEAVPI